MAVTQKDIARALNISQSMVAGVLGNRHDVWASPEKRQLILDQALRMGYTPNTAARRLRRGRSENVGLIVLNPAEELIFEFGGVVTVLAGFLQQHGYDLNLKIYDDSDVLLEALAALVSANACDIFLLSAPTADLERQMSLLDERGASYLVLGTPEHPTAASLSIDFDHHWLMERCVEHLAAAGHQHIAYLGHNNQELYARRLKAGFEQAYRNELGGDHPDELFSAVAGDTRALTEEAIRRWLALAPGDRPTAIVMGASDDQSWEGLEVALARAGLRLGDAPGQFAAAGLHASQTPLLFGEAHAFCKIGLVDLTRALCDQMLRPLLDRQMPSERHVRLYPPIEMLASLDLLQFLDYRAAADK